MPNERPYWNMEMESILGSEGIREIQLEGLRARAENLFRHAPYFRRQMEARGIEPRDMRSLEDWSRAIPVFTKASYHELMDECIFASTSWSIPPPMNPSRWWTARRARQCSPRSRAAASDGLGCRSATFIASPFLHAHAARPAFVRIVGRSDDMLKVKGVIVYPAAIDNVIASFIPRVTGEFHIALDEPPPRVVPPLKLRIERGVETPKSALAELEKEIVKALKERLKFSPAIIWLEPSRLERSTHKTRFIEVAPKGGLSLRAANSHQRTRTKTQQRGHP